MAFFFFSQPEKAMLLARINIAAQRAAAEAIGACAANAKSSNSTVTKRKKAIESYIVGVSKELLVTRHLEVYRALMMMTLTKVR